MKTESPLLESTDSRSGRDSTDEVIRQIARAILGVRYGSVEVVIQDSRVVQIERKEKFRFERNGRN